MTIFRLACALALALLVTPGLAQTTGSSVQAPNGWAPMHAPCVKQVDGTCVPVSAAAPLPVTSGSDGTTARSLRTDSRGGLVPAQGVVASTRTTLTASTATAIEAGGVSVRTLESIFTEAALTANVYICTTQATSCSAAIYDFLIPSGAGAGTVFTPPFATTGRLYAFSTGTPVLVVNSWTAP
ncbi:hypothetical protein [Sphingobium sp. Z007]|uniref:hypothetical protein n=1 Tax=Sphingobium sp. Z007 TaxID=627495 RepID=UPI000B4A0171|nr:hypothetical protein [Sphingobium sp. Z007]